MHAGSKRAFITGASGFLGAHLVYALLEKNYTVTALVRSKTNLTAFFTLSKLYPAANVANIEWIEGDLLLPEGWLECIGAVDVVFHAAAVVSFLPKDKNTMMETNVLGTANVVNACLKYNHKPIVYVSSVAALGRSEDTSEVNEHSVWGDSDHNTHYAVSKHLAEREVWRGIEEGLPAAVVCPGIIIGPWSINKGSGQIPALVKKQMPFYPVGENGFSGVRDVVRMLILVYETHCFGKRFLCISQNTSYRYILTCFAEVFSVSPPKIPLKGILLRVLLFLARLSEKLTLPFPFPSEGLKSTSLSTRYTSINSHLLPDMTYLPLEKTIQETADTYNK
jgi:nucleoside-diphosphate-sugar epimerase